MQSPISLDERKNISEVLGQAYQIPDNILEIEELSGGRINRTYKVVIPRTTYVVQQIMSSTGRGEDDMNRFFTVQNELRDRGSDILFPVIVRDQNGNVTSEFQGKRWHVQEYIQNSPTEIIDTEAARNAGELVGRLRCDLSGWEATPESLWPFKSDTYLESNHQALVSAIDQHTDHPFRREIESWLPELNKAIEHCGSLSLAPQPGVIHGDAKLANMIFQNNKAVGFVDPDNFEHTYAVWEVGQMLRSFASKGTDGKIYDPEIVRAALSGYNNALPKDSQFTLEEGLTAAIFQSVNLLLRFATDVLEESVFRWDEKRYTRAAEAHRNDFILHRKLYRELVADMNTLS